MPRKKKELEIEEQLRQVVAKALVQERFTLVTKLVAILDEETNKIEIPVQQEKEKF